MWTNSVGTWTSVWTNSVGDIAGLDARLRSVETGLAELRGQMAMVRDYIMGRNLREPGADE